MKKTRADPIEFLYGEVHGKRTTASQERALHAGNILHGHVYRLPSGAKAKYEVNVKGKKDGKRFMRYL